MTIGADPEIFLCDTRTGAVHPACGLVGGAKGKPVKMPGEFPKLRSDVEGSFGMQEDNIMLEFNIPAARDYVEFSDYIGSAMYNLERFIRTKLKHMSVLQKHQVLVPPEHLTLPGAREFGCSPDFDAYANGGAYATMNPRDFGDPAGNELRFAGGHVHLGGKFNCPPFVAAMLADVYLGLPSIAADKQEDRRHAYGQAGRFRPTSYGIEYRVLSNFWVFQNAYTSRVGMAADQLIQLLNGPETRIRELLQEIPWGDVQNAINTEDEEAGGEILALCREQFKLGV